MRHLVSFGVLVINIGIRIIVNYSHIVVVVSVTSDDVAIRWKQGQCHTQK